MDPIDNLFQKYLSGNASQAEKQKAEKWIKNHPKEFTYIKQFWQHQSPSPIIEVDVPAAMKRIDETSEKNGHRSRRMAFIWIRRTAAVAAMLTVLLASFIYFNRHHQADVLITPNTEFYQDIQLSDGSQINLNKGSLLRYPEIFSKHTRSVELKHGNAFFEVTKNPQKPFIISTPFGQVKVLGTSFNVFVGAQRTEVYVKSGRVELIHANGEETLVLKPEEAGCISPQETYQIVHSTQNFMSWRSHRLTFQNVDLNELMESLERHFQMPVHFKSLTESIPKIQFNGTFENTDLSDILDVIELTCQLKSLISDKGIVLSDE